VALARPAGLAYDAAMETKGRFSIAAKRMSRSIIRELLKLDPIPH
jgi:hypothetical protein